MNAYPERYGPWALITGASAGIGEAFARSLAERGMHVALVARRAERLSTLAADLRDRHGVEALPVALDLTRDDFLPDLLSALEGREVGMLINNAGMGLAGPFIEHDPAREADMVRLNCVAPTILAHHCAREMAARRRGAIVFVASVVAYRGMPWFATYSATKAFNLFMGEALWQELRATGVDVLAVSPGSTDSEFQAVAGSDATPVRRRTAEQVVQTAWRALGRRPSAIDGRGNALMTLAMRFGPARSVLPVCERIMRKHTRRD